jgi:hypothetical protein
VPFVSIDILPLSGRIATTKILGNGTFRAAGLFTLNSKSIDGEIHPDTEGLELRIGDPDAPTVFVVSPNDPNWKHTKGDAWIWRTPKGSQPIVNIRLDNKKHRFVVRGAKFGLVPQPTSDVMVRIEIGNDLALDERPWKPGKITGLLTYVGKIPK